MILFLLSVILFGAIGEILGRKIGLPRFAGLLIGAVFNLVGVVFLLGVLLAEDVAGWFKA